MTRGFIFDYGGTLDTAGCHWGTLIGKAYKRHGLDVGDDSYRQAYVHGERTLGREDIIKPDFTFRQTLETKLSLQRQWLAGHGCLDMLHGDIDAMYGAVLDDVYMLARNTTAASKEVLVELSKRNQMALVSNFYGNLDTVLREFGLDGCFETVVESAKVGIRKPDPAIFAVAMELMGMEVEQVTVVGDSYKNDIAPALQLGCRPVWLKGEGWGSEPEPVATDEVSVISSLQELL